MIKGNISVQDKDMGWKDIIKETRKFCKGYSQVGYFTSGGDPKTDIASRAVVMEYGATIAVTPKMRFFWFYKFGIWLKKSIIKIPARPFMRQTFDDNQSLVWNQIYDEYARIVDRKQKALHRLIRLGEWYAGLVKLTILTGSFKENSPFTVGRKGSSKPLVDTGEMVNSIRHIEVMK